MIRSQTFRGSCAPGMWPFWPSPNILPPIWDTKDWVGYSWVYFLTHLCSSLTKPKMIRLQWNSCWLRQTFSFFSFLFGGTGVWTQNFMLAQQALYHLTHTSSYGQTYFLMGKVFWLYFRIIPFLLPLLDKWIPPHKPSQGPKGKTHERIMRYFQFQSFHFIWWGLSYL
jgi:hypothetical protein